MKYLNFSVSIILLLTSFFVFACSSSKNSNLSNNSANRANSNVSSIETNQPPQLVKIKLKSQNQEPMEIATELKYGTWRIESLKDGNFEFLQQNYCLSNIPVMGQEYSVTTDGETVKVCFSVNESKRWQDKTLLSPGVFYTGTNERSDMGKVVIFTLEATQGKQKGYARLDPSSTYGNLTVDSSTDQSIGGKFALSDKNISINGSFTANLQ